MSFFNDLQKVLKQNIREYGMLIALIVIMADLSVRRWDHVQGGRERLPGTHGA